MNWRISVTGPAEKQLGKIHRPDAQKIRSTIDRMADNPFFGDIQKLSGQPGGWRRRVGSYRIFYKVNLDTRSIFIYETARRTSKTY